MLKFIIPLSNKTEGMIIVFETAFMKKIFMYTDTHRCQILSGRVLSNHWTYCSDILGYGRYGYEVVQWVSIQIKSGLRGWPAGVPEAAHDCLDYFSLTT